MRAAADALRGTLPAAPTRDSASGGRVLYGFARPDRPHPMDVYLSLPGTDRHDGRLTYGLRTDLSDREVDVAVVSSAVLAFDWSPSPGWPPLAVAILREMDRIAATVTMSGDLPAQGRARLCELAGLAGVTIAEEAR
jgi:hypothetical protein